MTFQGCQKDDVKQHDEYLNIEDFNKTNLSNEELRIIKEAGQRMSDNIVFEGSKIRVTKSSKELNMDQELFDQWYYFVQLYNDGKIDIQKAPSIALSRANPEDGNTGTRGGNLMCDLAANSILGTLTTFGWRTCRSYLDMWYFENRSIPYTMSADNWSEASKYAKQYVGINFRKNPVRIGGLWVYAHSVSYYNGSMDLAQSYGTATVYFNAAGEPVGFKDTYNFNEGDRSWAAEAGTTVIRTITNGGNGGYDIVYGIH